MNLTDSYPHNLTIVFLYDPIEVKKIPLDPIKASTEFDVITLLPDDAGGVLALASSQLKAKVTIQSNRLQYVDEHHKTPFDKRNVDGLWNLLRGLPNFSVRSFGVNFFLIITPNHENGAGGFLADHYVKDSRKLAQELGHPILSASTRLLLGTPDHYRDLRLTPTDIGSKDFQLQYHFHQDMHIADSEKLRHTLESATAATWKECKEWLTKLP